MIDLLRRNEFPAAALPDRLLTWTAPARAALGIPGLLPAENGAQRQRRALQSGAPIDEVYAAELDDTRRTYSSEPILLASGPERLDPVARARLADRRG